MKLSQHDIDQFLQDPSAEVRREVLLRIIEQYNGGDGQSPLSPENVKIIEALLRNLARHAEPAVRKLMAERLKETRRLPGDIAAILASSSLDIAQPVLEYSPVLSDDDLLEIIKGSKKMDCLMVIARRINLSEQITAALLAKKDDTLNEAVLKSFGSVISEAGYNDLLATKKINKKIVQAMLDKGHLPLAITEKLLAQINGKSREALNDEYTVVFERKQIKSEIDNKRALAAADMLKIRASDLNKTQIEK